jgi:hypothetical protein
MTVALPANTTRTSVRQGVAAYLGGSYVEDIRAYQNGPLLSFGLSTVRAGWGKRLDMNNFIAGQSAGRGMGAYMIVELGFEKEVRRAIAGAPVTDGNGQIIAGGIKFIQYRVQLQCFHLAQKGYAEDAQADIDQLIEAIKQQIRYDRTLGGICTQAGEGRYGIQTSEGHPGVDANGRTGTWFQMQFEILTQIIA